jgi:hypothetical protein
MAIRTLKSTGGNWAVASTWVENAVPNSSDEVIFPASGGNVTMVSNQDGFCKYLDMSQWHGSIITANNSFIRIYGIDSNGYSLKTSTDMTIVENAILTIYFHQTVSHKISAPITGGSYGFPWLSLDHIGSGVMNLDSDIKIHSLLMERNGGTFNSNGFNIDVQYFVVSGNSYIFNFGTSIVTIRDGYGGNYCFYSAGTTPVINGATATIIIELTWNTQTKVMNIAPRSDSKFGTLIIKPSLIVGGFVHLNNGLTIGNLVLEAPETRLDNGATVKIDSLSSNGTSGSTRTIASYPYEAGFSTFTSDSPVVSGVDWLVIDNVKASTTNTVWLAGLNSTKDITSTGWILSDTIPPVIQNLDYLMLGFVA